MFVLTDEDRRLAFDLGVDEYRRSSDPLVSFTFSSAAQRDFAVYVTGGVETYWRSANQGGKTLGAAAVFLALAQGRTAIGAFGPERFQRPVALPPLPQPTTFVVLTKSQEAQVDGPQKALLELLGDWPHHVGWENRAAGVIRSLWVMPLGAPASVRRNWSKWSRIVFRCEGSAKRSLPGGRIDGAWADEPPHMPAWRELRSRTKANQFLFLGISATPIWREGWEELERDFKDCQQRPREGRIELRSKLGDNTALSAEHIAAQRRKWKNDPHRVARETGDYVDVEGACPFGYSALARIEAVARRTPFLDIPVQVRAAIDTEDGVVIEPVEVVYQQWEPPVPGEKYLAVVDPALGIDDAQHDHSAILVCSRRRPRIVARYSGFLDAYGTGSLAAILGARYSKALVDVDMTGGYGRATVHGLSDAKYHNVHTETIEEELGKLQKRIGFRITSHNRGELVTECQQIIASGSVRFWSIGMVESFRGIRWHKGQIVARLPKRDEDMTCLGRIGVLLKTLYQRERQERDLEAERFERNLGLARGIPAPMLRRGPRPKLV